MDGLEKIIFEIISFAGSARSSYIEAIEMARSGSREEAKRLVKEGREQYKEGHHVHMELLQKSANGDLDVGKYQLLLMHAEDQVMSAETFGILSEEFIELYAMVKGKGNADND